MSKIKKIKKQIVNRRILKKKFTYQFFLKRTFRIFQKSLMKCLTFRIKHYKKFHNFWTSLDRWNRKQNVKNAKKNKKEILKDGVLLKFCISNISIFFEKKTVVLHKFLIKSRIHTRKQQKKFTIFLKTMDR